MDAMRTYRTTKSAMEKEGVGCDKDEMFLYKTIKALNAYVCENLLFGKIKVKEIVPIDNYIEELHIRNYGTWWHKGIDEKYIDKNINVKDIAEYEYRYDFFNKNIVKIFPENILKTSKFAIYKESIFNLFCEVLDININGNDKKYYCVTKDDVIKIKKFLCAVYNGEIKAGDKIGWYLRKMSVSPQFLDAMEDGSGFRTLAIGDINSIEYKLSVLSAFKFMNFDNAHVFMTKLMKRYLR